MKFAIVGFQHGHIHSFIHEMLAEGHQFAGIYDPSGWDMPVKSAATYGVPLFGTLDELAAQGVEMIGAAGLNDGKIGVIEWAEQRGIHVMADKPIAIDEEGLNRLRDVIDRGRIEVGMMLTARFSAVPYTLKGMIEDGQLGEIEDFTFLKPHKLRAATRPAWFFDKALHGGLILDLMIHDVDMLWWFTGSEITASSGVLVKNRFPEYPSFYENAVASLMLDGRITATLKADWMMPEAFPIWGDGRIFVSGSKGRAEIRLAGDMFGEPGPFIAFVDHDNKMAKVEIRKPPGGLTADFLDRIAGKPHLLTAEDMYRANSAALKLDRASTKYINV